MMLIYQVQSLPDLTLSKYQVFADSGIDGMLEAHTQFIRQIYRILLLGKINMHILFDYDPQLPSGEKLRIFLVFSGLNEDDQYSEKIKKIVNASNICSYFNFKEFDKTNDLLNFNYSFMSVLHKKERVLQTGHL